MVWLIDALADEIVYILCLEISSGYFSWPWPVILNSEKLRHLIFIIFRVSYEL